MIGDVIQVPGWVTRFSELPETAVFGSFLRLGLDRKMWLVFPIQTSGYFLAFCDVTGACTQSCRRPSQLVEGAATVITVRGPHPRRLARITQRPALPHRFFCPTPRSFLFLAITPVPPSPQSHWLNLPPQGRVASFSRAPWLLLPREFNPPAFSSQLNANARPAFQVVFAHQAGGPHRNPKTPADLP